MSWPVDVWILNDGAGTEVWSIGLDSIGCHKPKHVHDSLILAARLHGRVEDHMIVKAASLGTRAVHYPPSLVESIRNVDGGRNVERHHFDVAYLDTHPQHIVVGVGSNSEKRNMACKLALSCRLQFQESVPWHSNDAHSFTCYFGDVGVEFRVQRFLLLPSTHSPPPFMDIPLAGVWAEPAPGADDDAAASVPAPGTVTSAPVWTPCVRSTSVTNKMFPY